MLALDHITVSARSLAEGVAAVESMLGVRAPVGGAHPSMGTHNHLLRLGPSLFLEIIAINPGAPAPARPRWFGLDDPTNAAALATPRLSTWVARAERLDEALATIPGAAGPAVSVSRGSLTWRISVPEDGSMPFDGAFPTLIEWPTGPHPAAAMADLGCALLRFEVEHPAAAVVAESLAPHLTDERLTFRAGPQKRLTACIATPHGPRVLV
jgi:hypothetical protein